MTPEELMEDRFILENLWPGCHWGVGTIFPANFENFTIYPYLFRKLDWWEERRAKDLPKYVKCIVGNPQEIRKIKGYDLPSRYAVFRSGIGLLANYVPATKEEYNAQQTS